MKVKPAPGRAVRDPVTYTLLPDEGRDVPDNTFWRRRVRDKDVIRTDASAGTAGPAAQTRTRHPNATQGGA